MIRMKKQRKKGKRKKALDINIQILYKYIMAQEDDDLRALGKIIEFFRASSVVLLVLHCYWYCFETFYKLGIYDNTATKILISISKTGLFDSFLINKIICVVMLFLSCLGTRGVKSEKITWTKIVIVGIIGLILFFCNTVCMAITKNSVYNTALYIGTISLGFILLLSAGGWISRLLNNNLMKDVFNEENESFMQETRLIENEYSVNLRTKFKYKGKKYDGWINVINPFRATMVLGTPGSGKTFAIIIQFIKQQIEKGYTMLIYDFKYPDLSHIAYNHLLNHLDGYKIKPKFYVIDFDNPRHSHRCNPIHPDTMTEIIDAYEISYVIMLNLNKTWIQKQGDFFVESPIILFAAIIWYLKIYKGGIYCTFPHAIELLNKPYSKIFPILQSNPELENYLSPFMDAWESQAQDQLQGQISSAKIPLSRMISPALYWVMSGNDFTLDINNPNDPKILCLGNNPKRKNIYGAALGLYTGQIAKIINQKGKQKCSIIIDELPTIYFKDLDNLIATARSNKIAPLLGYQDDSQIKRDYGEKEARAISSTIGNLFSGQVVGETAENLSKRFGKILQQRQSISINRQDKSTSISTQMDSTIPASKISTLTQGNFVGAVADDYDQPIDLKIFNAEIIVDVEKTKKESKNYVPIPSVLDCSEEVIQQAIKNNYQKIKNEISQLVDEECDILGII